MAVQKINSILNTFWEGVEYGHGKSCSVCTLLALSRYFEMNEPFLEDIATPFGGGVCHSHSSVCGAVSGALLFLGLKTGKENSAQIGEQLLKHVTEHFGSITCNIILDIDFSDEEQVKKEKAVKYEGICQPLMKSICEWVINKLEKPEEELDLI